MEMISAKGLFLIKMLLQFLKRVFVVTTRMWVKLEPNPELLDQMREFDIRRTGQLGRGSPTPSTLVTCTTSALSEQGAGGLSVEPCSTHGSAFYGGVLDNHETNADLHVIDLIFQLFLN